MVSKWFKLIRLELNGLSITPSTLFLSTLHDTLYAYDLFYFILLCCRSVSVPPSLLPRSFSWI